MKRKREDTSKPDSVASFRTSYLQNLAQLQSILGNEKNNSVGEYLKTLVLNSRGENLLTLFEKGNISKKLIQSLKSKNVLDSVEKKVKGGAFTKDEVTKLCMIINLLRYIDVVFVTCPACGHIVSLSWGWCPYHGTAEQLKLEDLDGDGNFEDGFKNLLQARFKKKSFLDAYTDEIEDELPLFVHWTRFIISRG